MHADPDSGIRRVPIVLLAVFAAILCWVDVSWALRPGLFPILDEIGTRAIVSITSYRQILTFFPVSYYADRPLGWAFIKLMGDWFDFNYRREVAFLIAIHFANCLLGFRLFRRLGVSLPLAIAGLATFGGLWTTAQTATYLGESFDVICLFFLLASTLAILSERHLFSAALFLAALRSKEFGIVTPFLFTVLLTLRLPRKRIGTALLRRLWPHYLILTAFALRYAYLHREYVEETRADNLYMMDPHLATVLRSLSYYTSLVFGLNDHRPIPPVLLGTILLVIFCWAALRRRAGIAFGLTGYVLTALPVLLMPRTREAYWIYAPQAFLILALCLLIGEILERLSPRKTVRAKAALCVAFVCMCGLTAFRHSSYFRDRVHWTMNVRRISLRTAQDANAQFPNLHAGTHVYVNHSPGVTPWLFIPGPCSYLQAVNRERWIDCIIDKPSGELQTLYSSDKGPKYFVDYQEDGSIKVIER